MAARVLDSEEAGPGPGLSQEVTPDYGTRKADLALGLTQAGARSLYFKNERVTTLNGRRKPWPFGASAPAETPESIRAAAVTGAQQILVAQGQRV
jgi:hypothetical protein